MSTTSTPATPATGTAPVDLDALSLNIDRCRWIARALQIIQSGSGLPDGSERDGICCELAAVIEEAADHAYRLSAAL